MSDHTTVLMTVIPKCDIHFYQLNPGEIVPAVVDGATTMGPWANMCESCFEVYGLGLGLGRGQRFELLFTGDVTIPDTGDESVSIPIYEGLVSDAGKSLIAGEYAAYGFQEDADDMVPVRLTVNPDGSAYAIVKS